ncbi:YciI family protein [Phenylobacterium hankyongense]|uniref:YciI family protein n=1 Tax=Phenylobacterium hankyongense TaxID=1813876 RepID=A0A328B5K7_9CAUL|nr:YciI family protein [Phenylobacterium hankyongense]RAK60328.1 YciI family protein [Phenylobacterium hankyongense]
MMFMMAAFETDGDIAARGGDGGERAGDYWRRWKAFGEALSRADIVREMHGLRENSAARTVRVREGGPEVQEGAAGGGLHFGGYFIIDVPDAEAAAEWAARCPAAINGAVEIRPLLARPGA